MWRMLLGGIRNLKVGGRGRASDQNNVLATSEKKKEMFKDRIGKERKDIYVPNQ